MTDDPLPIKPLAAYRGRISLQAHYGRIVERLQLAESEAARANPKGPLAAVNKEMIEHIERATDLAVGLGMAHERPSRSKKGKTDA